MTHETDGINAYEYMYGYTERKAYELGYEDGTYRRQQAPSTNVLEKASLLKADIEGAVDWLHLEDASEYTRGWADGYNKNITIS